MASETDSDDATPVSGEPKPDEPQTDELWESELRVADAVGRIIEFWGFRRNMGRIWAVLYLGGEPETAQSLQARLALSSGAISMTLKDLLRWGVVRKIWIKGERRDHYVAEGNLWKMISRVYAERERMEIQSLIEALEASLVSLETQLSAGGEAQVRAEARRDRIKKLLDLSRIGFRLVNTLVSKARVDASALSSFLLRDDPPAK